MLRRFFTQKRHPPAPLLLLSRDPLREISGGSAVSQILKIGKRPEALTEPELSEIVAFASTAASLSTEKPGGISAIVPEKTVRARMTIC